ncbi:hypothetical protein LOTGIDRAFT_154997 [Lottia gigantea]|uniref:DNA-directed DNA polymerase n=1 Tax=Lottia gigantea TaxID=225164 RepID=V3ZSG9_LOTGI|nr:hypothetical protein LOTGIDRAFT_154997 [Lottia gigantea]ESO85510.1 hypothetical protein LOTGIDRAFT_154997 [Lottia gigantea]
MTLFTVAGLISFIQKQLVNVVNKTELQNLISLISKLDDKIAKQKLDIQQLIDNIPGENVDTFQQELNALETKLNSELQKELRNIKQQIQNIDDSEIKTNIQQQIQNIDDSEIKTYIQQQIQNIDDSVILQQITTINNVVLNKNILALEKYLKKENKSYYFNLPFVNLSYRHSDASITDNIDKSKDYELKKYRFTANIRVYSPDLTSPYEIFDSQFFFRGKIVIEIIFLMQFINGTKNVETKEYEINDENNKVNHLYEIKTSGKYIDRFRMLIIPDSEEHELSLSDLDMILETEISPSANNLFTSIDIHKSQQGKQFIIFPSIIERNDGTEDGGKIILRRNNFKEIKRSKKGSGVTILKKINEYSSGINCYIPSDRYCFVKCVNYVLNKDYTKEFQDFIDSFSKSNRKGVTTTARICEFNKKFNTNFQIHMPKHRHFQPKKVSAELDWVFYLHKSHFCLRRRNNKTLGIKEIEDNYDENIWRTCKDDNAVTQVSPLKLNVSNNLKATSLSLKGWYYLYHYDKEMVEEEWYETTRMVPKHTEKENVEKVYSHTHPFIRYFIRQSIKGGRVLANRKPFETNKMDEICNVLKEFSETPSDNIIDLFKEYIKSKKDKTEVNSKLKKIKCTKLMAFDANGLYASAMSDLDSEYPKAESARKFLTEEEEEFVKLFNKQKFRLRTAILKVWFKYPTNMFFQTIPAKDKITFTNKECKKETSTKIGFRNNFCSEVLTTVDIQEIVKAGGRIIRILDGIVYEENFKTLPYRDYILILRYLRNKYKREGKNDYGDGGIIYGLYLAPKVKYNIILTSDGILKEKKTFKGYSNDKIAVEDYIRLASGHDVTNEFTKPWEKSFTNGVVIPKDDDKQKKVLNLVKRKALDSKGIMYPYSDKDDLSLDETYKFDDFDYLTIQEENKECFITQ